MSPAAQPQRIADASPASILRPNLVLVSDLDMQSPDPPDRPQRASPGDPLPILQNVALGSIEVIAGLRDIDSIARWLSEPVTRMVRHRLALRQQKQQALDNLPKRTPMACGRVRYASPAEGVVEGVVVVHSRTRTRAVAVRLESPEGRWRVTSLAIL